MARLGGVCVVNASTNLNLELVNNSLLRNGAVGRQRREGRRGVGIGTHGSSHCRVDRRDFSQGAKRYGVSDRDDTSGLAAYNVQYCEHGQAHRTASR